jgi:hypothetical protein
MLLGGVGGFAPKQQFEGSLALMLAKWILHPNHGFGCLKICALKLKKPKLVPRNSILRIHSGL